MSQIDIFGNILNSNDNSSITPSLNVINNGEYIYFPTFFTQKESDYFLKIFSEKIIWKQESMNMYGKRVDFPRLTSWYGDNDKPYKFSGLSLLPNPWTVELLEIKSKIEQQVMVNFNSVLLNLYRNGNDSISWHTDAEPELGENPIIASVNFGETRKFQLRHKDTKEKLEIELVHGSVLIMQGELQHYWQHQVPKTSKEVGKRINLTFRVIKI